MKSTFQGVVSALKQMEELPCVAAVDTHNTDNCDRLLVHVRQIHQGGKMTPVVIEAVKTVHQDIYDILQHCIQNENIQLREVFCEGRPVDIDVPVPCAQVREFVRRIGAHTQMLYSLDHDVALYLVERLAHHFPNPVERVLRERMEIRKKWRSVLWGVKQEGIDAEIGHEYMLYNMVRGYLDIRPDGDIHDFLNRLVVEPIETHSKEAWRIIEHSSPEQLSEMQRYALSVHASLTHYHQLFTKRRAVFKKRFLRAIKQRPTGIMYGEERLFAEGKLELRGGESALLNRLSSIAPFEDDEDMSYGIREQVLFAIIEKLDVELATTVFGAGHDFRAEIDEWNTREEVKNKLGLVEITPGSYEAQFERAMTDQ